MRASLLVLAAPGVLAVPQRLEQPANAPSSAATPIFSVPKFVPADNAEYGRNEDSIFHQPLIDHINSVQSYWRAVDPSKGDKPHFHSWTNGDMRRLVPFRPSRGANGGENDGSIHKTAYRDIEYVERLIPRFFDARRKWYDCESISNIRDQGSCGGCWTFGTTSSMADRICIHSKGKHQLMTSALDLGACCEYCSQNKGMCEGGEPQDAYYYWMTEGITTGDNWMSSIGCKPYSIEVAIVHIPGQHVDSPKCEKKCANVKYNETTYADDKIKGKDIYRIRNGDTKAMQWEIMTNGPITISFDVYDDFPLYKEGIYMRTSDKNIGEHTVTIIGWGEENGIPYWNVKNSWNRLWGHHGYFRMVRGQNECKFENEVLAGMPDL